MFDNAGLPRAAHKSNLSDAIWKLELKEIGKRMMATDSNDEVIKLGERAIVLLVAGQDCNQNWDTLRYHKFALKVMTSSVCVKDCTHTTLKITWYL